MKLSLTIPQADGQLADAPFQAGTVDDYNSAVAGLASQAQAEAHANATAAAQAQQQANAQAAQRRLDAAVSRADATFGSDLAAITDATKSLGGEDLSFHASLSEGASALAQARKDYAHEEHDVNASPPDCGTVGSDDATVGSDEASVASGQASVESATIGVSNEIDGLTNAVSSAKSDLATLQRAQAVDPAVTPLHGAADKIKFHQFSS